MGYPKIDGLQWKIPLKWMIWGYHRLWKPPYVHQVGEHRNWMILDGYKRVPDFTPKEGELGHDLHATYSTW